MGARPDKRDEEEHAPSSAPVGETPRLVYTQAPVVMGRLLEATASGWRVDLGAMQRELSVDPAVDPALLVESQVRGARVLVDTSGEPTIVGVVQTARAIVVDRDNRVEEQLDSVSLTATREILLRTPGAFVRAKGRQVELYGDRVLHRARDAVKILAAMIKLN
ncbi:MAG: hypothetical protein AB8I08_27530 [Sandaracinaceae bacterium]